MIVVVYDEAGLVLVAFVDIRVTQHDPQNVDFLIIGDLHNGFPSQYTTSPPTTVVTTLPLGV